MLIDQHDMAIKCKENFISVSEKRMVVKVPLFER